MTVADITPARPGLAVVPIRDGRPSLRDIAGWLRLQADRIEACADNDLQTLLIVTMTTDGEIPAPCCYGDNPSRAEVVGLLHMAAHRAAACEWSGDDD